MFSFFSTGDERAWRKQREKGISDNKQKLNENESGYRFNEYQEKVCKPDLAVNE
jgi:hypothetical protein